MASGYPASNNTFVPSFDAGGQLVVSYSRNPKDFPLNNYVTLTPVKKSIGYYLNITAEQAARILNSDIGEHIWHDGNDAPSLSWGNESFEFKPYATSRYAYGFRMGYKAVEQADWQIVASHAAITAQQAMTGRAITAIGALSNTANYASNHTATATAIGGAKWNVGTVAAPSIKKSILAALQVINKDTLGTVGAKDVVLVVNPNGASGMAASDELQDAVKHGTFSKPWLEGKDEITSGRWGLPEYLYGVKVVVDDTVKVTSVKGATFANGYVLADTVALLLARPGSLVSQEGAVNFSTGHFFMYEEMTVETRDDVDNRRKIGRTVDDWDFRVVAPASGYVVTAIT